MKPALDDLFYEHPEYGRKSFQWHLLEAFFAPIAFLNRGMLLPAMVAILIYAAFIAFLAGIAMLLVDTVPFGLSLSLIILIPLAVLLACWADATIHRHIQKNGYRLSYRHFVPGECLLVGFRRSSLSRGSQRRCGWVFCAQQPSTGILADRGQTPEMGLHSGG